jgi:hypothetical protein
MECMTEPSSTRSSSCSLVRYVCGGLGRVGGDEREGGGEFWVIMRAAVCQRDVQASHTGAHDCQRHQVIQLLLGQVRLSSRKDAVGGWVGGAVDEVSQCCTWKVVEVHDRHSATSLSFSSTTPTSPHPHHMCVW